MGSLAWNTRIDVDSVHHIYNGIDCQWFFMLCQGHSSTNLSRPAVKVQKFIHVCHVQGACMRIWLLLQSVYWSVCWLCTCTCSHAAGPCLCCGNFLLGCTRVNFVLWLFSQKSGPAKARRAGLAATSMYTCMYAVLEVSRMISHKNNCTCKNCW